MLAQNAMKQIASVMRPVSADTGRDPIIPRGNRLLSGLVLFAGYSVGRRLKPGTGNSALAT
jgi:hypothetical protein